MIRFAALHSIPVSAQISTTFLFVEPIKAKMNRRMPSSLFCEYERNPTSINDGKGAPGANQLLIRSGPGEFAFPCLPDALDVPSINLASRSVDWDSQLVCSVNTAPKPMRNTCRISRFNSCFISCVRTRCNLPPDKSFRRHQVCLQDRIGSYQQLDCKRSIRHDPGREECLNQPRVEYGRRCESISRVRSVKQPRLGHVWAAGRLGKESNPCYAAGPQRSRVRNARPMTRCI